ncbi:hypothetical protein C4588_03485 [Candidatus Parcubacteria bacterium]|nr:MAG: hypothetical protein C4588_03485 [Candidatus Parcubacteria bacterium]
METKVFDPQDLMEQLLQEVSEIVIIHSKRCRWPNIPIGKNQVVVGKASHRVLSFIIKIREIESDLKKAITKFKKLPKAMVDERAELETEVISPLKDMLILANSMLKMQLRLEFPGNDKLGNKDDIGVGREGKAFYWSIPGRSPKKSDYVQLLDRSLADMMCSHDNEWCS